MLFKFYKYQGTGNDFIVFDDRSECFPSSRDVIQQLTDRRFGIGGDGIILIQNSEKADFRMIYYNPDGSQSLCGNGSRCAVEFANRLNLFQYETNFEAVDGIHHAFMKDGWIHFNINDLESVINEGNDYFIENGSPHFIRFVTDVNEVDIQKISPPLRHSTAFNRSGMNVNFVQLTDHGITVRTYERGVENETLSCGTGVTAAAIASSLKGMASPVNVTTKGGSLRVTFDRTDDSFRHIYLSGPVSMVFEGEINITTN
jgi:diaminopimelate epimerase